jgi:hypothetical protein
MRLSGVFGHRGQALFAVSGGLPATGQADEESPHPDKMTVSAAKSGLARINKGSHDHFPQN